MADDKVYRVAYTRGFAAGHRKFEAEFDELLKVSEGRLREINKLKADLHDLLTTDIPALILKKQLEEKSDGTKQK